jgi:hypothetical protein
MCPELFQELDATYAALIEIDRWDAGFCARAQAPLMAGAHTGASLGLTGNQPEWFREARRSFGVQTHAERSREWEPYQGHQRRSHRSRTREREASLDWSQLKQVWSVEQERHTGKTGRIARESRDSVTHLHRGRLKPEQILAVVR